MGVSNIGNIIKWKRTLLGLSQEDLADGICAVATLSRIENGERMPTQNHLELLLQRLGYSDVMLENYVDENDFHAHELKFKIREAYINKEIEAARDLLQKFEVLLVKPSKVDKQFLLLENTLLYPERYSNQECLSQLEAAILLTQPKYQRGQVPALISYEEIVILNNIAISLANDGCRKEAIDILYAIAAYYDNHIVNIEEALRTEPMTLYNLSKYLGLENRYSECVQICNRAIELAKKTGRYSLFAQTMYNKSWALLKRGHSEDWAEAKDLANKALNIAMAFGDMKFIEHCKRYMQNNQLL